MPDSDPWWRTAVIYQVYPRSFADSNGDGIGDLAGITARIPYLGHSDRRPVAVARVRQPQVDHGYDISDYRAIDPLFGSLADLDDLVAAAHEHGIRVTLDFVPNHTSDQHAWFRAALAAGRGSAERAATCSSKAAASTAAAAEQLALGVRRALVDPRAEPDGSPGSGTTTCSPASSRT